MYKQTVSIGRLLGMSNYEGCFSCRQQTFCVQHNKLVCDSGQKSEETQ